MPYHVSISELHVKGLTYHRQQDGKGEERKCWQAKPHLQGYERVSHLAVPQDVCFKPTSDIYA